MTSTMLSLLGVRKSRSPAELVRMTVDALGVIEKKKEQDKYYDKAIEDVSKHLASMKTVLYGDGVNEPNPDLIAQLANETYTSNLIQMLITDLTKMEFEARKDVVTIFSNLLRRQIGTRLPTVEHIVRNPTIIQELVSGYEDPDIALNHGTMLRECLKHEPLCRIVLFDESLYKFFAYVELPNFDVASDAFVTFKDLLTKHKQLAAEFLETNYDQVFARYNELLRSENYVTRRQSVKLLGELLLDRTNFAVMTKFISSPDRLKAIMNMLRDRHRSIQFESFHLFKIFAANPNKPPQIHHILVKNREKLISFLSSFHNDKDDEQFNEEKALLIKEIGSL